jgi:hypothetical protein
MNDRPSVPRAGGALLFGAIMIGTIAGASVGALSTGMFAGFAMGLLLLGLVWLLDRRR